MRIPPLRDDWKLRPGVTYLNHGSFGPAPKPVLAARQAWFEQLEAEPMDFYVRQMEDHLAAARERLATFVGTRGDHLTFMDNATFGMNIVAAGFPLSAGDEVLATNHEYGAVQRIWRKRCEKVGARFVVQRLPEPLGDVDELVEMLFAAVTPRTRLLVVSHITSPTAVILPVQAICRAARQRGVAVCIDGPHAPAAVSVGLDRLDCDFYVASCHKWLSAPFGSGFLYVHSRARRHIEPVIVSWGASLSGRPATWHDEYLWMGTRDPSPFLAVPAAIEFLERLDCNGTRGLDAFRNWSRGLVRLARDRITRLTGVEPLVPDDPTWFGTMLSLPLPDFVREATEGIFHPLQSALWERFQIETPIVNWHGRRFIRVSCHLYNDADDIERLTAALEELLGEMSAERTCGTR
jgi:isopenicillin-N epimerase